MSTGGSLRDIGGPPGMGYAGVINTANDPGPVVWSERAGFADVGASRGTGRAASESEAATACAWRQLRSGTSAFPHAGENELMVRALADAIEKGYRSVGRESR
jgi:hypothetical protein